MQDNLNLKLIYLSDELVDLKIELQEMKILAEKNDELRLELKENLDRFCKERKRKIN